MRTTLLAVAILTSAINTAKAASPRDVDTYLTDEITTRLARKDCKCACTATVRVLFAARTILREQNTDLPPLGTLGSEIDALVAQRCAESKPASTIATGPGGGGVAYSNPTGMYGFAHVMTVQPSNGGAGGTHMGRPDTIKIEDFLVAANKLPKQSREELYRELPIGYCTWLRAWANTNPELEREIMGDRGLQDEMAKITGESVMTVHSPNAIASMMAQTDVSTAWWTLYTDELPLLWEPDNEDNKLWGAPPILAALSKLEPNDQHTFIQALPSSAQTTYRKWIKDLPKDTKTPFDIKSLFDLSTKRQ